MVAVPTVIDQHLQRFDGEQRAGLEHLSDVLRGLLPGAEECLSYNIPTFKVNGRAVAGFEGYKKHSSYFPHSGNVIHLADPLPEWCETARGTLRFPIERRLPVSLVKRLVRIRLAEIDEKYPRAAARCAVTRGEVDTTAYDAVDGEWRAIGLAAPARRALVDAGLLTLKQLRGKSRGELSALHGMGPKALTILDSSLGERGWSLRP